mmetsp:Transcript_6425/g.11753  ORF Transcript_6425/g.11753 Transcript_6425/m.11753 type:complete len:255 (-) Transcript_6425:371-1135(-)
MLPSRHPRPFQDAHLITTPRAGIDPRAKGRGRGSQGQTPNITPDEGGTKASSQAPSCGTLAGTAGHAGRGTRPSSGTAFNAEQLHEGVGRSGRARSVQDGGDGDGADTGEEDGAREDERRSQVDQGAKVGEACEEVGGGYEPERQGGSVLGEGYEPSVSSGEGGFERAAEWGHGRCIGVRGGEWNEFSGGRGRREGDQEVYSTHDRSNEMEGRGLLRRGVRRRGGAYGRRRGRTQWRGWRGWDGKEGEAKEIQP